MRPLGHTETRKAREERIFSRNERLDRAWELYLRHDTLMDVPYVESLLAPIRPTREETEHFIISRSSDEKHQCHLGIFASGAYALLPEETIVYPLDTPELPMFGFRLEKTLIITGKVGADAGYEMRGTLVNYGTLGDWAVKCMVGTFVNHGAVGDDAALNFVGEIVNGGTAGARFGRQIIGAFSDYGTCGAQRFEYGIGQFDDHGVTEWRCVRKDKNRFLRDIMGYRQFTNASIRMVLYDKYIIKPLYDAVRREFR
jgi:hypothetical protein